MCNAAKQVILDLPLPTIQKFVAYRVAELVNDHHDHEFWMHPASLADEVGLDPGTVRKYLSKMVDAGLMVRLEVGGGRSQVTRYQFVGCAEAHDKPRRGARNTESEDETAPGGAQTAPGGARNRAGGRVNRAGGRAHIGEHKEHKEEPEEQEVPLFPDSTSWNPSERNLATARKLGLDDDSIDRVVAVVDGLDLPARKRGPEFVTRCNWEARALAKAGGPPQRESLGERLAREDRERGIV